MRTIQEIGLELKDYRINNNIDVDKLAQEMKVSKRVIELMENDKYEMSNVRKRLLYKKYIERLGLDYSDYEKDIREALPSVVEETINLSQDDILDEIRLKKKFKINKSIISIIIIFLFLIVLLIFTIYNFNNNVVNDEVINQTTLLNNTVLEPATVIEPKVKELEVSRTSPNQVEVTLESLEDVNILIKAQEDVYYDYSDSNIIKEQGTIQKDKEKKITIKDATNAKINIGNLTSTKVYINDYEITQKLSDNLGVQNYISFKLESKKE